MHTAKLTPGLKYAQSIRVADSLTVPAMSRAFAGFSDMPPVFATAFMIGFIEWTCIEAVRDRLQPGQHTVGTHVSISHEAATPIGMTVTAMVELVEVAGRKLRFSVECRDDRDVIGRGFHERFIIELDKFARRLSQKTSGNV